jgi:glucosylceramidase
MRRQGDVRFRTLGGAPGEQVTVDPSTRYQTLTAGFGVAMTDTSAYVLEEKLSRRTRAQVMRKLFSRVGGIGLSFLRVPIGGSDYVVHSPYTYDDVPPGQSDPRLLRFSIAHDGRYVIPAIRQALATATRMTVMANPWTPPAWMKTDDSLITRTGPLGTLIPGDYGVYAQYLIRFLQAYKRAGIPVHYLGVQNEPLTPLLFVSGIPESYLSPQDEGQLIHGFVAPALRRLELSSKIVAYDDGFNRSEGYIPIVMGIAGGDVGGLAYHCYLSDASSMTIEHGRYPLEPALETECSSKLSNIEPAQMAIRSLRNWAQGVQLWNAALDQHFGPKIGNGCQGVTPPYLGQQCIAPVIVNTARHTYSLTSDYWELAQFSKFIRLGARRIASTTPSSCIDDPAPPPCGLEDVAFRNPDGSEVLVATAHDGSPHTMTVNEHGRRFSYTVPDGATTTFVWPAPRPRITKLRVRLRLRRHQMRVRLRLSEDARLVIQIKRGRARHRLRTIATVRRRGVEGLNDIRLPRRVLRRLRPGRYRLVVSAVDAGGNRSRRLKRFVVRR